MKYLSYSFSFLFLLILSCSDTSSNSDSSTSTARPKTDIQPSTTEDNKSVPTIAKSNEVESLPDKHTCEPKGNILEDNQTWIRAEQLLVCIAADSITNDMDFGESHRLLDVYDTKDCHLISRNILPVNLSPDFPYYLNLDTYDEKNKVICTQGFEFTFCFDLEKQKLMPRLKPQFLSKREATDAQSGLPMGLKLWEHYLFGYSQDFGACAFDIKYKTQTNHVMPIAEYPLPDQQFSYQSLFVLEVEKGKYQAVIPLMEEEAFTLKTLFQAPKSLTPSIAKRVRNNRFLIFNIPETQPVKHLAIDMKQGKEIRLPKEMETKKSGEILDWLKKIN